MLRILTLILSITIILISVKKRKLFTEATILLLLTIYDSFPTIREAVIPGGWKLDWIGFPAFFPIAVYPNGGLLMHPVWYSVVLLVLGIILLFCLLHRRDRITAGE